MIKMLFILVSMVLIKSLAAMNKTPGNAVKSFFQSNQNVANADLLKINTAKEIKKIYQKYNGDKNQIQEFIKNQLLMEVIDQDLAVALAKEFFYLLANSRARLPNSTSVHERKLLFLNLSINYGFSIQELLENNIVSKVIIELPFRPSWIFSSLDLSYLKINSLEGLDKIPNIASIQHLNLSQNLLTEVDIKKLLCLESIKWLDLSDNPIVKVDIENLKRIKSLDLILKKTFVENKNKTDFTQNLKPLSKL